MTPPSKLDPMTHQDWRGPSVLELMDPSRRTLLHGSAATALLGLISASLTQLGACATGPVRSGSGKLGFQSVPPSKADAVVVPPGYTASVLAAWGEPVGIAGQLPPWKRDASNTAAEQAVQMGMHHDGLAYFALDGSRRGLLVVNHEYTDDGLLHPGGMVPWTADKVAKAQAAHGVSVIELALQAGTWQVVRPSRYARRFTANTPFAVGGPAAGHRLMKTAADPEGRRVLGTLANCGCGQTPWGTYLSGEENFADYFIPSDQPTQHERRWGIRKNTWYRWQEHDDRFDTVRHPNEPHRFGWVVEIDPMDPNSTPVKRTALGRAAHEGATVAVTRDQRVVVYSGEDAAFEYIYKFVSRDKIQPAGKGQTAAQANAQLLDHGTLYVARFEANGRGRWLPLVHGQAGLTAERGFADQGEVLIKARQASDALAATPMDRPEWLAVDASSRWVYCALTNNSARGSAGRPAADAANPRNDNTMGHIIRWKEEGDHDGLGFEWNHLLLAGDAANSPANARGNIKGDAFSSPDTLAFDPQGRLWIGTDVSQGSLNQGDMARLGNNQLLVCDVATAEVRRFLTGPVGCEIAGATWTPDGRTLFVNVQHPGESAGGRSDPGQPSRVSNWPDFQPGGRPRSATLVVRKDDGGVIGS
jgi:secreted PhoX family phosphatase